jgi:hypothetical protein
MPHFRADVCCRGLSGFGYPAMFLPKLKLHKPLIWAKSTLVVGETGGLIGFSKPGASHPVSPRCFQRLGHCVPLSFTAFGGKIQAIRYADGR